MGNDPMGLLVDRQRDTIEKIAFASPLAEGKIANGATFRKQLVCMQKMFHSGLLSVSISVVIKEYSLSSHSFTGSENVFSYLKWHLF